MHRLIPINASARHRLQHYTITAPRYLCKLSVLVRSTVRIYGIVLWYGADVAQRWGLTEKLVRARVVLSVVHVVAGWA